ncbi:MAG: ATP-binding protein [Verrucomicrobia bacterium]|nr:ATP-binding protein [Verrucomicrobiota bacterium]
MGKFKTRARTVDMLGRQQIAGIPTAISELFKNAHDAYADHVEIDFFRSDRLFILRDDGMGMTREEFENRWLTIGTESKLNSKAMPLPKQDVSKTRRTMLGEKGIGRLSIAIIGPQVLVITRAKSTGKPRNIVASFLNWGIFEVPGINLEDIEIPIREFSEGNLPSAEDIQTMVDEFRKNLPQIGKENKGLQQRIESELKAFSIDPIEIDSFLESTDYLSLNAYGSGTHFIIKPATELLIDDIDSNSLEKASPLEKALLGFTDTMTPSHELPVITTSFRDYKTDTVFNDLIDKERFFTPNEFNNADHNIIGEFDKYGQFKGTISIYGDKFKNHIIPWMKSQGLQTKCGPFKIAFADVQGKARETTIPMEEWTLLTGKMDRLGGLYIFKNGIRILPYGDTDYDWVGMEYRRTKSAQYYHFSHRRIFGAIKITSKENGALTEKAGREGFRENEAYRQLKNILENFFLQLAADFFREGGTKADIFIDKKAHFKKLQKAEEIRAKQIRGRKGKFESELEAFFRLYDESIPEKDAFGIAEKLAEQLETAKAIANPHQAAREFLIIEEQSLQQLKELISRYKISKPKIGLSQSTLKDWNDYQNAFIGLQVKVFQPIQATIEQEITLAAQEARLELDRRLRIKSALKAREIEATVATNTEKKKTAELLDKVASETKQAISQSIKNVSDEIAKVFSEFNSLNITEFPDEEIVKKRIELELQIEDVRNREEQFLIGIRNQLEAIQLDDDMTQLDQLEALEQKVVSLEEAADADLQLTQMGMAIEVINHEFNSSIRGVRNRLRELKAWAELNEGMEDVYSGIRASFDHLDSYLTLFTPLHRRLYRTETEFDGADINKYLNDLFGERLKRHDVEIKASKAFLKRTIIGYPSSFYPVFVNIVDNAIFWLKNRTSEKIVQLNIDGDDMLISDTGPGISERDRESIFELGFTRKPGGRGMGLHISRNVLQRVGYTLSLDPGKVDAGATFRIAPLQEEAK